MLFSKRIKELRQEASLSQAKFADILGISTSTIHKWEQGKSSPKATLLIKICKYFHVRANYLLGVDDKRN